MKRKTQVKFREENKEARNKIKIEESDKNNKEELYL